MLTSQTDAHISAVPKVTGPMKLHVVGLAHTETTREYDWCAFTAKVRKFSTMMTAIGYDVRLYAGEQNEANCTEYIPIISRAEQKEWFAGFDRSRDLINNYDSSTPPWMTMNARAAEEIRKRVAPGDVLSMAVGLTQKPIADALAGTGILPVETGIGYHGVWAPYRIFESHANQHFLAAREPSDNVRFFDQVIPNYFEVDEFPPGKGDGGYFLYFGRVVNRKGPHIAAEVCKRLGAKLIVAGQGIQAPPGTNTSTGPLRSTDGTILDGDVEYVGPAGPALRAKLLGGARAVFVPSIYLEPFGGIAVESMLCGTPAIAMDWGAFTETVVHGVTGFRCLTLAEFVDAARRAGDLDRNAIRQYAIQNYSTEVVGQRYDQYFKKLTSLSRKGWYEVPGE